MEVYFTQLLFDSREETFIVKFLQDHLAKITQRPKQKLIHKVPQLSSIMYPSSELSLSPLSPPSLHQGCSSHYYFKLWSL